jgi:hypothetical protein
MAFTYKLENEDGTPADPPRSELPFPHGSPATRSHSAQAGHFASAEHGPQEGQKKTWC